MGEHRVVERGTGTSFLRGSAKVPTHKACRQAWHESLAGTNEVMRWAVSSDTWMILARLSNSFCSIVSDYDHFSQVLMLHLNRLP